MQGGAYCVEILWHIHIMPHINPNPDARITYLMSLTMKKLPVGIQTFSKIIEGDYLYIDKTEIARSLIDSFQYVFLSRPRRFGKSLFLDTLHNIFEGNR